MTQTPLTHTHHLFPFPTTITPLLTTLSDLPTPPTAPTPTDPFHPSGFITAFSTFSVSPNPLFALSTTSISGLLADLENKLDLDGDVSVEGLRAYLQILEVGSLLGVGRGVGEHAFRMFKECAGVTCLRNRNVEALATAALVQAIREAQEPRTLQEISAASNLPQKEIGKYIKVLGESLQLSQPINSNSIAVHMPRFCSLLQLNKSAQELAAHIGEVVVNKCFCTRRNPISISAAAIYLACQLEDKRKTQAEICKVTGLTEVTLRKVYKELLENWDDLLPPNYTPAVPPEKAFPMTAISSSRPSTPKVDMTVPTQKDKYPEIKRTVVDLDAPEMDHQVRTRERIRSKSSSSDGHSLQLLDILDLNKEAVVHQQIPLGFNGLKSSQEKETKGDQTITFEETKSTSDCMQKDSKDNCTAQFGQVPARVSRTLSGRQQIGSDSTSQLQKVKREREDDDAGS